MTPLSVEQVETATQELAKLPLLGPVWWLLARDPKRRYTFHADMEWRLMPPLVLDQCRLFKKRDVPWGFCTWAFVSQPVHERLQAESPLIAPHEWNAGPHPWLIDVVAPFGDGEVLAKQAMAQFADGRTVHAWMPGPSGTPALRVFPSGQACGEAPGETPGRG